jgi:hypothetical protein
MPAISVERTLVKSPPELWEALVGADALGRRLGDAELHASDPPRRLEWQSEVARGVIELDAAGWGTRVRAMADTDSADAPDAVEHRLEELLEDLGSSSLSSS